jgi:hypothetical protein
MVQKIIKKIHSGELKLHHSKDFVNLIIKMDYQKCGNKNLIQELSVILLVT